MIQDGEIYIGQAVCPISVSKINFDPQTNCITTKTTEVSGRKISLLKIRKDHLKFMERKGLLRETQPDLMPLDDLKTHLTRNKGIIFSTGLILKTSFHHDHASHL